MIECELKVPLPLPWTKGEFETNQIGAVNFLVGPNGSGKSQFANRLRQSLQSLGSTRLLDTDRLRGMEQSQATDQVIGRPFESGFGRGQFQRLKDAGAAGSGIDTVVLLEERIDLRIRIQATLSNLFDREISLEWDEGRLTAMVTRTGYGTRYRLDREECHGIKELLVLLTHLYDGENQYLIIDEPELNLHPQFQSFFMQEVRQVAGDPRNGSGEKVVFLITHSPFILDLQSSDDVKSIITFDLDYSIPKQVGCLDISLSQSALGTLRMNAHHKQFFFSDNPIFVEGILDALIVEAVMKARGTSVSSAGSCVIDAGGVEQVNSYLKLCQGLGKTAYFLYDLDSLFRGNLRRSIAADETIQSFLGSAGLGNDFGGYCGQLERELTKVVKELLCSSLPPGIKHLGTFLAGLGDRSDWDSRNDWPKARIAVMTAISKHREDIISVVSEQIVGDIEGRLRKILSALREKNIYVLPGGTLERYLPSYTGDEYDLAPDAKREAVYAEIEEMTKLTTDDELASRYEDLYEAICALPSKSRVDYEEVLRDYLSSYIHDLQRIITKNPKWQVEQIRERLTSQQPSTSKVFSVKEFERLSNGRFEATIVIAEILGESDRAVRVDDTTNAAMDAPSLELTQANV